MAEAPPGCANNSSGLCHRHCVAGERLDNNLREDKCDMMGFLLVMSHLFDDLQLVVARNVGRDEYFAIFVMGPAVGRALPAT